MSAYATRCGCYCQVIAIRTSTDARHTSAHFCPLSTHPFPSLSLPSPPFLSSLSSPLQSPPPLPSPPLQPSSPSSPLLFPPLPPSSSLFSPLSSPLLFMQYCRQTFFENDIIDQHKEDEEREYWQEEELTNELVKKQDSSDEKLQASSLSRLQPSTKNPPKKLPLASSARKGCSPDIPRKSSLGSSASSTPPASFKYGCEWVWSHDCHGTCKEPCMK